MLGNENFQFCAALIVLIKLLIENLLEINVNKNFQLCIALIVWVMLSIECCIIQNYC